MLWSVISVVSDDLPVEEHIFNLWPLADVVQDHVAIGQQALLVNHHANVRRAESQVQATRSPGK